MHYVALNFTLGAHRTTSGTSSKGICYFSACHQHQYSHNIGMIYMNSICQKKSIAFLYFSPSAAMVCAICSLMSSHLMYIGTYENEIFGFGLYADGNIVWCIISEIH